MHRGLRHVSLVLAVVIVGARPALLAAQTSAMIDVGSFSLSRNGERIGREQFSIRSLQGPDGPVTELRAEAAVGTRRSAFRLEVDSGGQPLRYAVELRSGADVQLRLGGQRVRGRFATLARGLRGEAAREYLLAVGVHVLDEGAVHQYAALLEPHRTMTPGQMVDVPLLVPLENRQTTIRIILEARDDAVTIAGTRRAALRWRVLVTGGNPYHVWTDAEGRLLRVSGSATGFEALRDDVPR